VSGGTEHPVADDVGLQAAADTTGRSVLGGTAWSIAGKILPQLYTLVLSIVAAHFLTRDEFGRQSFIAFVELSLVMFFTGGLPVALMRYVGETLGRGDAARVRGLVSWAWRLEGAAAAVGASVLIAVAATGADPAGAWALAGVACALGVLNTVPSALLIGAQRWRAATIAGLVSGGLGTAATVLVLAAGGGITGMFAVEAATSTLVLAWTTMLSRRAAVRLSPTVAAPGALRRAVSRFALVGTIGVALNFVVWRRSEFFFLNAYSTDSEIALYSIAFAFTVALSRVPEAFAEVSAPAVATLFGAGRDERIRSGVRRAARLLLIFPIPLTVAGIVLGPPAIDAIWGSEYDGAGTLLIVMLATFPLLPLFYFSRAVLIAIGRQKVLIALSGLAALVDIGLAALLVPHYAGTGAALANAGGQVTMAIPTFLYARSVFGSFDWAPMSLARTTVASAVAGAAALGVVRVVSGIPGLLAGGVAGIAVFIASAGVIKILPPDDARWVDGTLGGLLGGRVGVLVRLFAQRA
jgi:O-antigen/teichoic acid export membrane protein